MSKPTIPLSYARRFLAASILDALVDYTFGDSEVQWRRGENVVADGYFSREHSYVSIAETRRFATTRFENEEAEALKHCGLAGRYERNDGG